MIKDDFVLLNRMINDSKYIEEIYKPTNYWQQYIDRIIDELHRDGIKNIRNKKSNLFNIFGGSEVQNEYFRIQTHIPILRSIFHWNIMKRFFSVYTLIDKRKLQELAYYQCHYFDQLYNINKLKNISIDINSFSEIIDDIFYIDENPYTINFLQYYMQYIYMSRFIDFNKIRIFVDLGCGMSKVSEIIHKLHPHITILLFDIVPTVYFTEQYMKSIFGNSVIGYNETHMLETLDTEPGKIYIFPNWKFPIIKKLSNIDVFMNSGSFQEMEPDVVNNYLSIVQGKTNYVYLREAMEGSEKAKRKGKFGSISPVTYKDYRNGLSNYLKIDCSLSIFPLAVKKYKDVIFRRI